MTTQVEGLGDKSERLCASQTRQGRILRRFPALGLLLSGLLTLCGAVHILGTNNHGASLTLIAVAIVLGIAAMKVARSESILERGASRGLWHHWVILGLLLMLHGFLAHRMISTVPVKIDCYTIHQDAAASLLQGRDPYGTTHANIYNETETRLFFGPGMVVNGRVQVGFPYPPVTFLSALPGYLLGDVRYGYVAAILLSAIFVFALMPNARGLSLAAFILLSPVTYFVEHQCWTEALVWALLCATLYTAVKHPRWLPLALGLFLASKQYNFLALPFLGYLLQPFTRKAYWKLFGASLAVAMATVLPFAIWNFHALWHDLVLFHLAQPVRQDALSFAIPFPLFMKLGPLLLLAFIVWGARRGSLQPAIFAVAYGMALLLFFSTSKQAFLNYYFLIAQAFLLAATALWPARHAHALLSGSENTESRLQSEHANST
jgi:hypothetical protein